MRTQNHMDTEFEKKARQEEAEIKRTVEKKLDQIHRDVEADERKLEQEIGAPAGLNEPDDEQ